MITYTMKNPEGRVKVVQRESDMQALNMLGFWVIRMAIDETQTTLEFDPAEVRDAPTERTFDE